MVMIKSAPIQRQASDQASMFFFDLQQDGSYIKACLFHLDEQRLKLFTSLSKFKEPAQPVLQHTQLHPHPCSFNQLITGGRREEGVEGKQAGGRLDGRASQIQEPWGGGCSARVQQAEAGTIPVQGAGSRLGCMMRMVMLETFYKSSDQQNVLCQKYNPVTAYF
eukprot:scaffold67512_cov23-Tisochrysis_lutea.AAC.1